MFILASVTKCILTQLLSKCFFKLSQSWLKILGSLRNMKSADVTEIRCFKLKIFFLKPSIFQDRDFNVIKFVSGSFLSHFSATLLSASADVTNLSIHESLNIAERWQIPLLLRHSYQLKLRIVKNVSINMHLCNLSYLNTIIVRHVTGILEARPFFRFSWGLWI